MAASYTTQRQALFEMAIVGLTVLPLTRPFHTLSLLTSLAATPGRLMTINVLFRDGDGQETFYENLGLSTNHPRSLSQVLAATPSRRIEQLENSYSVEVGADLNGATLLAIFLERRREALNATLDAGSQIDTVANIPLADVDGPTTSIAITGGNDGALPLTAAYTAPLQELQRIEDISIVASPGYSANPERNGIQDALVTHAEARRAYRFAVLDMPVDQTPVQTLNVKSTVDSSYAAFYHPWVVVANPNAVPNDETIPREVAVPPSGFVCGIFARNDNSKGVAKSPGNEVVRGALRFQTEIGFSEQELMNPRGVNCLRTFPGRGHRLWGARTASSDPEWKYVGPRRYFLYLEHSIDRSTQWAVFENNGPNLWANVRETVSSFLYNEWRSNSLLGATPEEAFFVRCDRTTMTQSDLDNGRLICLIGVAVLKPAEFVVFRIGQKTADAS